MHNFVTPLCVQHQGAKPLVSAQTGLLQGLLLNVVHYERGVYNFGKKKKNHHFNFFKVLDLKGQGGWVYYIVQ